jgi:hypothetical protein
MLISPLTAGHRVRDLGREPAIAVRDAQQLRQLLSDDREGYGEL